MQDPKDLCCKDYEQLVAVPSADLSHSEQQAVDAHRLKCSYCAEIDTAYRQMRLAIRNLAVFDPAPAFPARLWTVWKEEGR